MMNTSFLSASQARDIQKNNFKNKIQSNIFATLLKECITVIEHHIKTGNADRHIYYKVPLFRIGWPVFDVDKAKYYLYRRLKHKDYQVYATEKQNVLYITWAAGASAGKSCLKREPSNVRFDGLK